MHSLGRERARGDNKYKIIIFPGPADQFDLTVQPVNRDLGEVSRKLGLCGLVLKSFRELLGE